MAVDLILTGDVNLMNVTDPAVPFRRVREQLREADLVFSNLECCFYEPEAGHSVDNEGFYATSDSAKALLDGGIHAVGIANNVNYGSAAILSSIDRLDSLGIPHTGAGRNRAEARAPVVLERDGCRFGFLQRSCVYWPTNHEALDGAPGIAVIRGHTAYHVPMHKTRPDIPPPNRPGVPPDLVTWADPAYLTMLTDDVAALRKECDAVILSCHWGLFKDVLQYMREIAHAAVDAGAAVVFGHGPHFALPVEVYKGRPIYYGLGSFSFHTGHGGHKHGDWVGMMARLRMDGGHVAAAGFEFVRHNDRNETLICNLADEAAELDDIRIRSRAYGTELRAEGNRVMTDLANADAGVSAGTA
jgi:poly-gamma-glutamate capsule biosynthesis protein CapA/YwtB (metallophosphatase superfamily)